VTKEALKLSRFEGNRLLAGAVGEILTTARTLYRDYQTGKLSEKEITGQRPVMEAQLLAVLHNPPLTGWPAECPTIYQSHQASLGRVVHFFR
jgi:hypothetical protein